MTRLPVGSIDARHVLELATCVRVVAMRQVRQDTPDDVGSAVGARPKTSSQRKLASAPAISRAFGERSCSMTASGAPPAASFLSVMLPES